MFILLNMSFLLFESPCSTAATASQKSFVNVKNDPSGERNASVFRVRTNYFFVCDTWIFIVHLLGLPVDDMTCAGCLKPPNKPIHLSTMCLMASWLSSFVLSQQLAGSIEHWCFIARNPSLEMFVHAPSPKWAPNINVDWSNKEELRALDAEASQLPKTPRLSRIVAPCRLDGRLQSGPLLGRYSAPCCLTGNNNGSRKFLYF